MSNDLVAADRQPRSVLHSMADRYGMEPENFRRTLMATVMPSQTTKEEFAAFLVVAQQYGLNPITQEIYAFPKKGGGIQPIVGIDGWMNLINSHPQFDGMEFEDRFGRDGKLLAITCRIHRKDRSHPIVVTEYLAECQRGTEPWKQWPARMLRHKAAIQAARYAFGYAGIIDEDEAERSPAVAAPRVAFVPPAPPEIEDAGDGDAALDAAWEWASDLDDRAGERGRDDPAGDAAEHGGRAA